MDPGGFNDVLRFERDASGLPKGLYRGSDEFSGSALDGTDGTQSELCARRFSQRLPIPIARPGYQVLPQFYEDSRGGRNQGREIAGAQSPVSEPQRFHVGGCAARRRNSQSKAREFMRSSSHSTAYPTIRRFYGFRHFGSWSMSAVISKSDLLPCMRIRLWCIQSDTPNHQRLEMTEAEVREPWAAYRSDY